MARVVCTGCSGGLVMNPADCTRCDGECFFHVDEVSGEHIVRLCACRRCTEEKLRVGLRELFRTSNIPH